MHPADRAKRAWSLVRQARALKRSLLEADQGALDCPPTDYCLRAWLKLRPKQRDLQAERLFFWATRLFASLKGGSGDEPAEASLSEEVPFPLTKDIFRQNPQTLLLLADLLDCEARLMRHSAGSWLKKVTLLSDPFGRMTNRRLEATAAQLEKSALLLRTSAANSQFPAIAPRHPAGSAALN